MLRNCISGFAWLEQRQNRVTIIACMMDEWSRFRMLIGDRKLAILQQSHVALFGLGGVGGFALEALARSGIGHFDLIDADSFALTNLNRQLLATQKTIGLAKCDVAKERILSINPKAEVTLHQEFVLPDTISHFDFASFDGVIDAVDTVSAKIAIIVSSQASHTPIISCLGCGNRMDPTQLKIGDLFETNTDPLARVMRHELRKRGVTSCPVIYSKEKPLPALIPSDPSEAKPGRKSVPGSSAFVPSVAGIELAYWMVWQLLQRDDVTKNALSE